jgi:hypothetical protein
MRIEKNSLFMQLREPKVRGEYRFGREKYVKRNSGELVGNLVRFGDGYKAMRESCSFLGADTCPCGSLHIRAAA